MSILLLAALSLFQASCREQSFHEWSGGSCLCRRGHVLRLGGHVLAWGHVLRWGAVGPSASYAPLVVTVTVATESVLFGGCCVGVFCGLGFVWVACFRRLAVFGGLTVSVVFVAAALSLRCSATMDFVHLRRSRAC